MTIPTIAERPKGRRSLDKKYGTLLRARAVADGLPPLVSLATQISTSVAKNMVSYRGSGPIPPGLYHSIFTGQGRPKPVTEKAKSSTIGPQAGRVVQDQRNGRYEKQPDGQYKLRDDKPPSGLEASNLEISFRDIYRDVGAKYSLEPPPNPDADNKLKFHQNHESPQVSGIIYSVDIGKAKPIPPQIIINYKLVSNEFQDVSKKKPEKGSPFYGIDLDSLVPVSAQHPGDSEPKVIKVLGGIVRDCDMDIITDPSPEQMEAMLGTKNFQHFLEPLDMSAHVHDGNDKEEKKRANNDIVKMIDGIVEIIDLRWDKYHSLKEDAKSKAGTGFNEAKWELENAHLKPFIPNGTPEMSTLDMISAMVVTVGKGTPMQLYQALEINILEQKILASTTQPNGTKVDVEDLDSSDMKTRNSALMKIHNQEIVYSRETVARSFIQHPSECHNEHYTSPRETSVAVCGANIIMGDDGAISKIAQRLGQRVPINTMWIAENSPGNKNADVWVSHFLANSETHYKGNAAVVKEVEAFLKNPKNIDFIAERLHDFEIQPNAAGAKNIQTYLTNFLNNNPTIKNDVTNRINERQAAIDIKPEVTPVKMMR